MHGETVKFWKSNRTFAKWRLQIGQLAPRIERNGRRRSLRRPKLSAIKESSAPGRRRRIFGWMLLGWFICMYLHTFFLWEYHFLFMPLQPRFGCLWLLAFPKAKITVERLEICECDSHTVHKLSQRRLTADWLAPRESDCSRTRSRVSSGWLPSYIKATPLVLEIFKMPRYFLYSPHMVV